MDMLPHVFLSASAVARWKDYALAAWKAAGGSDASAIPDEEARMDGEALVLFIPAHAGLPEIAMPLGANEWRWLHGNSLAKENQ